MAVCLHGLILLAPVVGGLAVSITILFWPADAGFREDSSTHSLTKIARVGDENTAVQHHDSNVSLIENGPL